MNFQELYVVCQIDDFSLKVMVNRYVNNKIQILYKEAIKNEQFAENGTVLNPPVVGQKLKNIIIKIEKIFKIKVQRISLSLPSNNLKIYQSRAMLDFKEISHKVTSTDIAKVIDMTKNIVIAANEVICLTKPYNFKVDDKIFNDRLPLNINGQIIAVESLIYTVPDKMYNSHIAVLKFIDCQLLSLTLDQFALAFNLNNNNSLVLIDCGLTSTKISLFANSALYAMENIKTGFKQIVELLMKKMHCNYLKAEKYLTKIINLESSYLNDLVVDKYHDETTDKTVNLTRADLQAVVADAINDFISKIIHFLAEPLSNDPKLTIIFSGITINLPGFSQFIKNYYQLQNAKFLINSFPGIDNCEWDTLIGITYYQHNLNLFNNLFLTSINNHSDKENELVNNNSQNKYFSYFNFHYNKDNN